MNQRQQNMLNFLPSNLNDGDPSFKFVSALHDEKFDMMVMREGIAHWILMHEHAFSIVEEEGFNLMLKRGIPQWTSVSRYTIRTDSFKVYEAEKKKLKDLLNNVEKISLTTDLWRSKPQKIKYMVLTAHFVDKNWKLQKRVLNFVHIPPPRKGKDIANCIFKCLKEWDIESKVFTVSLDNASANDSCINIIKDTFSLTKRLICGGKLFHVRCCAHILNIMVQHGLKQVKTIVKNVHDTVDYLNGSEHRLKKFAEIVQQFNLKERRLILECKTRWNSTFDMLVCALKFKEVFSRLALEDSDYVFCPSVDDWDKIEKLVDILEVFYEATMIISGSEYPTSNLFLGEVYRVKRMLYSKCDSSDVFVKEMVKNIKERFDKYWGECNLLMSIAVVLDPQIKLQSLEIVFPTMFSADVARENIHKVKSTLYELYDEYVHLYSYSTTRQCGSTTSASDGVGVSIGGGKRKTGMFELIQVARSQDIPGVRKSETESYLEQRCFVVGSEDHGASFDILGWWKDRTSEFPILSRLAADILAVPITTVASETTFNAGSRVIDPYRSSLSPETVQMLICTGDWCRSLHGVNRKNKDKAEQPKEIIIPIE
ncbi:zinc finger BED domain-containing protein RICESLEEPER 2 [Beta vulgaris subsp. vulgaris]|uniref:zinc finger BED domain-containing protein RICESLEEPER 2 n=1 Tax=Beta vulgaris subsp. vulgaris TaxID=3555 RepID=UPI002037421D|nr:zinc finger BED domain-containing protein RICESLEEPER 2 [Beta vulgaris subsp. vulgaris]